MSQEHYQLALLDLNIRMKEPNTEIDLYLI